MLKPNSAVTTNLIRARELIADKKNWCKDNVILGKRRCAVGALRHTTGVSSLMQTMETVEYHGLTHAALEAGKAFPEDVNDELGHAAVMRMFDRAIELSLQDAS